MDMESTQEKEKGASPDVIPSLIPFENVFELTDGGIIGGNNVVNDPPQQQGWTSSYENNHTSQVKLEDVAGMMTGMQPNYAIDSSGQHYPSVGSGNTYGYMGHVYGSTSQVPGYGQDPNNMPFEPLAYQNSVEDLTNALQQKEGMLNVAQAMNISLQNAVNTLRAENENLKSHYSMSCASYSNIFNDLNRSKGLEANLSKKIFAMKYEKSDLRCDLDWVMKKAIPRVLSKVFRSDQFDHELGKVEKVFVEHGRELGREEAREILMASQRLPGRDPNLHRKIKQVIRGFKRTKWDCVYAIISSPDLSPNLLRSVLERGDGVAGEGSSSRHVA